MTTDCSKAQYTNYPTNVKCTTKNVIPCSGERINGILRYQCSFCDRYKTYVKGAIKS